MSTCGAQAIANANLKDVKPECSFSLPCGNILQLPACPGPVSSASQNPDLPNSTAVSDFLRQKISDDVLGNEGTTCSFFPFSRHFTMCESGWRVTQRAKLTLFVKLVSRQIGLFLRPLHPVLITFMAFVPGGVHRRAQNHARSSPYPSSQGLRASGSSGFLDSPGDENPPLRQSLFSGDSSSPFSSGPQRDFGMEMSTSFGSNFTSS